MKRTAKKLSLNRDTIRTLSGTRLQQAAAGIPGTALGCTLFVSCGGTCVCTGTCVICGTETTNLC
jgi:hypothetical protein